MRNLPPAILHVLRPFERLFSERVWEWANILLVGAILAPGKRTVTACLRVMGLSHEKQFQAYHRVLNRATWSSRKLSRVLLTLLLHAFVKADAPVSLGIDEHLERRRGRTIAAKGDLSRLGSFQHVVFRHVERLAVGVLDAARAHSMGQTGVGVAILDRVGPVRALLSGAQATAQAGLDVGAAHAQTGASLAAAASAGCHSG